jgi:hypothetical protein
MAHGASAVDARPGCFPVNTPPAMVVSKSNASWSHGTNPAMDLAMSRNVHVELFHATLVDAITKLSKVTDVVFMLDSSLVDRPPVTATLDVEQMSLANALYWLEYKFVIHHVVRGHIVCLCAGAGPLEPVTRADDPEFLQTLAPTFGKFVHIDFQDSSLEEVIEFMHRSVGVSIICPENVDAELTLKAKNIPLSHAFKWICSLCNVQMAFHHQAIVFLPAGSRPDSLNRPPVKIVQVVDHSGL